MGFDLHTFTPMCGWSMLSSKLIVAQCSQTLVYSLPIDPKEVDETLYRGIHIILS